MVTKHPLVTGMAVVLKQLSTGSGLVRIEPNDVLVSDEDGETRFRPPQHIAPQP